MKPNTIALVDAACLLLAIVQAVMLMSLYMQLAPYPPRTIPLFAMAPFLAVSIATALCARQMVQHGHQGGIALAALAAIFAAISFGPQKYVDPQFEQIWIAVIACQIAIATILVQTVTVIRQRRKVS